MASETTKYAFSVSLTVTIAVVTWFNQQEKISALPQAQRLYEAIDSGALKLSRWRASPDLRAELAAIGGISFKLFWVFVGLAFLSELLGLHFLAVAFGVTGFSGAFLWGCLYAVKNPRRYFRYVTEHIVLPWAICCIGVWHLWNRMHVIPTSTFLILLMFITLIFLSGWLVDLLLTAIGFFFAVILLRGASAALIRIAPRMNKKKMIAYGYLLAGILAILRVLIA
jgi:hypothetical protein